MESLLDHAQQVLLYPTEIAMLVHLALTQTKQTRTAVSSVLLVHTPINMHLRLVFNVPQDFTVISLEVQHLVKSALEEHIVNKQAENPFLIAPNVLWERTIHTLQKRRLLRV